VGNRRANPFKRLAIENKVIDDSKPIERFQWDKVF